MIRLADEPWAPVAQGHTGAEVVRSVRVALRGTNDHHHRVAAKVVSKIERGRSATSVHGFVLAVFRARARARARSIMRLYHSILDNALLGREFGNG